MFKINSAIIYKSAQRFKAPLVLILLLCLCACGKTKQDINTANTDSINQAGNQNNNQTFDKNNLTGVWQWQTSTQGKTYAGQGYFVLTEKDHKVTGSAIVDIPVLPLGSNQPSKVTRAIINSDLAGTRNNSVIEFNVTNKTQGINANNKANLSSDGNHMTGSCSQTSYDENNKLISSTYNWQATRLQIRKP